MGVMVFEMAMWVTYVRISWRTADAREKQAAGHVREGATREDAWQERQEGEGRKEGEQRETSAP